MNKSHELLHLLLEAYDTVLLGCVVENEKVKELQAGLMKFLQPFNPEMIEDLHVSLAYVMKTSVSDELTDVLEDAKHYDIQFEAINLALLPGQNSNPYDYLVLKLKPSASLFDLIRNIKDIAEVKEMPGGFKTHLSLMKFKKGELGDVKEKIVSKKFNPFPIKPTTIALWNDQAKIEKEVTLAKEIA